MEKQKHKSGDWGGWDDSNVYYNPEECGLKLIASLEKDLSYEFDVVILVQDVKTKTLWLGHDSGCSCPTPFEDTHSFSDLTSLRSESGIDRFLNQYDSEGEYAWNLAAKNDFRRTARAALRRIKKDRA